MGSVRVVAVMVAFVTQTTISSSTWGTVSSRVPIRR